METNDTNDWTGKHCKIFVKNLSDKPIIYTAEIISDDGKFIIFEDRDGKKININKDSVVQMREE